MYCEADVIAGVRRGNLLGALMDYEIAKVELLRHAGIAEDHYAAGFLGCLRPYSGLRERNFHQVVEALLSAGSVFSCSDFVDRRVTESVLCMCHCARRWGVDDDGMLVRNKLVNPDDRRRLQQWVTIIEKMMLELLAGRPPYETLHVYCEYVAEFGWGENFDYFLPLLACAIEADDIGDRLQGYCAAIIRLGPTAHPVAKSLVQVREREWCWYEPHEQCAAEMLRDIDRALAAISGPPS